MKVLFVCPFSSNDFIPNLKKSLYQDPGAALVHVGYSFFDNSPIDYDIVHIHWEDVFAERKASTWQRAIARLKTLKKNGAKVLLTRHNRYRHSQSAKSATKLKADVYQLVDCMIHMSQVSLEEFNDEAATKWPAMNHVVIPHPNYSNLPNETDRNIARKILQVPDDAKTMLVFGGIRTDVERQFILDVFEGISNEGKFLLVPRWKASKPSIFQRLVAKAGFEEKHEPDRRITNQLIDSEEIQLYFNAADVVLIPRIEKSSLNSGVIPLAFTFGTPVAGPRQGSIGEMLESANCPLFEAGDVNGAVQCVERAFEFPPTMRNDLVKHALDELGMEKVGKLHLETYRSTIAGQPQDS